jgi:hypothetical protein
MLAWNHYSGGNAGMKSLQWWECWHNLITMGMLAWTQGHLEWSSWCAAHKLTFEHMLVPVMGTFGVFGVHDNLVAILSWCSNFNYHFINMIAKINWKWILIFYNVSCTGHFKEGLFSFGTYMFSIKILNQPFKAFTPWTVYCTVLWHKASKLLSWHKSSHRNKMLSLKTLCITLISVF